GKYHPHGDASVYDTLVRMAQPWAMRSPLIDGQGNFGSVDGDPPAAYRYTESRLQRLAEELLADLDKDTVDRVPTFDESHDEPVVLPAKFPNLLANGSTGIAVGMATNIPPHNLSELVDGLVAFIEDPEITIKELMKHIKGPDFPTGGLICGIEPIKSYFETGRGIVKIRGRVGVEEIKGNKEALIITEIPYNVCRADLVSKIADLVNQKRIEGISDIRDESDEKTRIVIELKRDVPSKVVINNLFKFTALESSFAVIMLALDHQRPRILNLKEALELYLDHRREVVLRRTRFELRKAEERAHILEGYKIALSNLDDFVKIIRAAKDRDEAKGKLIKKYELSEVQATAILELRLYQLTGLERDKIEEEYLGLIKRIEELNSILKSEQKVLNIIKSELMEIKERYGQPRLSQIVPDQGEINMEDLIPNEGCIITLSHAGFIKRSAVSQYRSQHRGGKGVIGQQTRDEDFIEHMFTASTHDFLMFFTNTGRAYVEKVYEIPEMGRATKGRSIANLLELRADEKIAALIRISGKGEVWTENLHLVMATGNGIVKKTNLAEYKNHRKGGIIGIQIEPGDKLIGVKLTGGNDEIVLVTRDGMSIRFNEDELRDQGRATVGVWGIRLAKGDEVVAIAVVDPKATLLVAGEHAIGKRTHFEEYRKQSRGGQGIITMRTGDKTGLVVGALTVHDHDEIMLITKNGKMVRTSVNNIRESGRATQGVRLVNLDDADKLTAIARVVTVEQEDAAAEVEAGAEAEGKA
ncbi:MAG: DNA gyrase subunit A, partial [Verrucomicrobiae bacterium]|nr:DNA gyrase subunit A [Verrucomicrobiae bacterium]